MKHQKSVGLRILLAVAAIGSGLVVMVFGSMLLKVIGLEVLDFIPGILGFVVMGYCIYKWSISGNQNSKGEVFTQKQAKRSIPKTKIVQQMPSQKPRYSLQGYLPEEQAKLNRLYESEVYPALSSRYEIVSDVHDKAKVSNLAVQALTKAVNREPNEYLWYLELGKHLTRLGRFADTIKVCERALALHPDDPRAECMIATGFRYMTRAVYCSPVYRDRLKQANEMFAESEVGIWSGGLSFDPDECEKELQKLGMSWQDAARESVAHFRKATTLELPESEIKLIDSFIESMRSQFSRHGIAL